MRSTCGISARLSRPISWLALGGIGLLLVGLVWDVAVHLLSPDLAAYEGESALAIPAHQATVVGVVLAVCGMFFMRGPGWRQGSVLVVRGVGLALIGSALILSATVWGVSGVHGSHSGGVRAAHVLADLLASPLNEAELPPGFAVQDVRSRPPSERLLASGAVGAVDIVVESPDAYNHIGFRVFPGATEAAHYFAPTSLGPTFAITGRSAVKGLVHPARCETYADSSQQPRLGWTDCLILVGNVVVVGSSAIEGDIGKGNSEHAALLADAGVAHLESILVHGHR
jgi:hypothetical protein